MAGGVKARKTLYSPGGVQHFPASVMTDSVAFLKTEAACAAVGQPLTLRRHAGYDHGYYFIASFVDDHLRHHARTLDAT